MKEIQLEYLLKTSSSLLFNRISSASGLAEWFADDVVIEGKRVTFYWGETTQKAEIVHFVNNESIRFRWHDTGVAGEFEFRINEEELTGISP